MDNIEIVRKIAQYIQERFKYKKENILIAVTGQGCSGKTSFCKEVIKYLPNSKIFFLDGYYYNIKKRRNEGLTGAHPKSLMNTPLFKDLNKIRKNIPFRKLVSNISPEDNIKEYIPAKYNLIDGLPALLIPDIRLYNLIIYIECDDKTQLKRRLHRDNKIRKRTKEDIINSFKIRDNQFQRFILPKRRFSNIILRSNKNYKLTYIKCSYDYYYKKISTLIK